MTGALGTDGSDVLAMFVAMTVNVYAVSLVRPVTVQVSATVLEQV